MAISRFDIVNGKRVKCYDNGGKTFDRYTVIYLDEPEAEGAFAGNVYNSIGMSEHPQHPQGFGQHCTAECGFHLGRRIPFVSLPPDCRKAVEHDCA